MIKVEHGKAEIRGFGAEILAEATILLEAIHHSFEEQGGEIFALACMASVLENYKNSLDESNYEECEEEEEDYDLPMQDSLDGIESNFDDIDPLWWD